jgi:hypothetical protein
MTETQDGQSVAPIPPWLGATAADLGNCNFETPIESSISATSQELSEMYVHAAKKAAPGSPQSRLFATLSAVTGMHLKARERDEPFGPMAAFADGRRSAIPADFRDAHVNLLVEMTTRSTNTVLKARLADVCWLLDRRRSVMGPLAISAYLETIESVEGGTLKFPFSDADDRALDHRACELLRRALSIGRAIGWERSEVLRARNMVTRLRERATRLQKAVPVLWFSELDMEFGISEPSSVAKAIESMLSSQMNLDVHLTVSLWRLSARGYHLGKQNDKKYCCQLRAAEALVAEAERIFNDQGQRHGAALHAAHLMMNAIAALHGSPVSKARRTELKHRLVDIQALIPEQMSTFKHRWELESVQEQVRTVLNKGSLLDKLFVFASLATSPDPNALVAQARESMQQHPLSSLFPTVYIDRDGLAVHRTAGAGLLNDPPDSAINREVAQAESIRRNLVAATVEMARVTIMSQHFIPEELLVYLLRQSPFVPSELLGTFSRGFLRFFQGDFTSATYTLTPLLENSLRHVLKMNGHDVTTFDDASQTQQLRTISLLFQHMRDELDTAFTKPITTDIENVFLTRPGPHLRHDIAHGLAHDSTPYGSDAVYACWLIFRLCLLPLLPYRGQMGAFAH